MRRILPYALPLLLAACGSLNLTPSAPTPPKTPTVIVEHHDKGLNAAQRHELAMHAINLLDTGYKFGGKNPEAGLDCSGLVTVVYQRALGWTLPFNAWQLALRSDPVAADALEPGDLVFFNTLGTPRSHVGIYLGGQQFIHAPRTNSRVRVASLTSRYFQKHFEGGRRLRQPTSRG